MRDAAHFYKFGDFRIYPDRHELVGSTKTLALPKQTMAVLVYLVEHHDRVISGSELLEQLWPDRVVEESTIHRQISQLRTALGDSARNPRYIRTISKRGYQAVADVCSVAETDPPKIEPVPATAPRLDSRGQRPIALWFGALAVTISLAVLLFMMPTAQSPKPTVEALYSVAVIPLTDLTGEPDGSRIAIGMTDELLSRLSEDRELRVASRVDAARVNAGNQRLADVAMQLGVHYIVEGSVQQDHERLRVTAQLIRAADGFHVWSVDRDLDSADLVNQARVTRAIAHVVRTRIFEDIRRASPHLFPEFEGIAPEAVSLYLDSEEEFNAYTLGEAGDTVLAMRLMEQAAAVDPLFDAAWMDLAWSYAHRINPELSVEEASRRAHQALAPVLARNPESSEVLFYLAQVYLLLDLDYASASDTIAKGMAIEPTGRWWNFYLSTIARREGRLEDALALLERSVSRDFGEESAAFLTVYAGALYDVGEYERALKATTQALAITPGGMPRANALFVHTLVLIAMGEEQAAIPLIDEAWAIAGTVAPGMFGVTLAGTDQVERARMALDTQRVEGQRGFIAEGHVALGDTDRAFALLAEGIEARDPTVLDYIRSSPLLTRLAPDPRYAALIERLAELEIPSS